MVIRSVLDLIEVECSLGCGERITPTSTEMHVLTTHPEHYEEMARSVETLSERHALAAVITALVKEGTLSLVTAAALMIELGEVPFA